MTIEGKEYLEKKYGKISMAKFLKAHRLVIGISQTAMASKLGWSRANLNDLENGRSFVGLERAKIISKVFEFPLEFIVQLILQDFVGRYKLPLEIKCNRRT